MHQYSRFYIAPALALVAAAAFSLLPLSPVVAQQKDKAAPAQPAMTSAEIMEKLNGIPVFTLMDEKGTPLSAAPPDKKGKPLVGVFISPDDARSFLANLKKKDASLAGKVRIVPVPLGQVYRETEENQAVRFSFVPERLQLEAAQEIRKKEKDAKDFQGTPLFMARTGEDDTFLTLTRDKKTVIPLFFEKQAIDRIVARMQEKQPELGKSLVIEAVSLENILNTMRTSNSDQVKQLEFIPMQAAAEFTEAQIGPGPEKKKQ